MSHRSICIGLIDLTAESMREFHHAWMALINGPLAGAIIAAARLSTNSLAAPSRAGTKRFFSAFSDDLACPVIGTLTPLHKEAL